MAGDRSYDGVFLTGVRTTGIFCRPTCPARKPRPENVEFFRSSQEALAAGYRACLRCHPMDMPGAPRPGPDTDAMLALVAEAESQPERRWRERDLIARGLNPDRVRRWFVAQHGMSFHAWQRARRLGRALSQLRAGSGVLPAALDAGFDSMSGFSDALRQLVGSSPARARGTTIVHLQRLPTPLGPLLAGATDEGVLLLEFTDRRMLERQLKTLHRRLNCAFVPGSSAPLAQLAAELEAYFAGEPVSFRVPLLLPGSDFQREVWAQLQTIPRGATASYAEVARAIGRPAAVRAVARANGDNRIAILVPCHRVIGSDGQLTGYGGGLWRKRWLLELEGHAGLVPLTQQPRTACRRSTWRPSRARPTP